MTLRCSRSGLMIAAGFLAAGCGSDSNIVGEDDPVPPVAVIESPGQDTTVTLGDAVTFLGSASDADGTVVGHAWTYGDGNGSGVEDPGAHTYASAGVYAVGYTVTDDDGATATASVTVTVTDPGNQAPEAVIESPGQDTTVTLGDAVTFLGSASDADGTVVGHAWTYGDGNGSGVEDPGAHMYASAGVYAVGYTVTDDDGATATATRSVTVTDPGGSNYALRFYGNGVNDIDRVKIPIDDPTTNEAGPPVDVGAGDVTIEFWMRASLAENGATVNESAVCNTTATGTGWITGNIVLDRDRKNTNRSYGVALNGTSLVWGISGSGSSYTQCGTSTVVDGAWHHVALIRDASTGRMAIYVDGLLDVEALTGVTGDFSYPDGYVTSNPDSDPFLVWGAEKHDLDASQFPPYSGYLDELRFSETVRYAGASYVVPGRFTPDEWTVGLYHLDEGGGEVIGDDSGAPGGPSDGVLRVGGSPEGPVWAPSDAPTGGS